MRDGRAQLSDLFALVMTIFAVYGEFWIIFEFLHPFDETIFAAGVLAVRGAFIDTLGPTRGGWAFIGLFGALAVFLNVLVFTDLIGPDMMDDGYTGDENGGGAP